MDNINEKQPWSKNQITQTKNSVPRSMSILTGHIANSMNAGHNKTIAWKKVMAGERHQSYNIDIHVKILTPKTPPYQKLHMTIRSYFVPNSRVWENAEAYTAQKGGLSETKIQEIPNLYGLEVGTIPSEDGADYTSLMNTEIWKKLYISSYVPRITEFKYSEVPQENDIKMPRISVLPLRGRKAIYNDFERNKELDEELEEFKTDNVTSREWNSYLAGTRDYTEAIEMQRAKKPNSYFTDVRMELQGFSEDIPQNTETGFNEETALLSWANWEAKIAEARSQAENAQLNNWDVIAKIRGSKKLTEGKVQLIGERNFTLNYSTITQSSYNTNENVSEEFQVMGTQGAYSYTNIKTDCYSGMIFNEEGYVHIIATVYADTVYEKGIDRNELNVNALDEYRPDLKDEKKDVMYRKEIEIDDYNSDEVVGFKRRFSEYFKLPNIIAGDMTTDNYLIVDDNNGTFSGDQLESNATYQLYENAANYYYDKRNGEWVPTKWWRDYSDLAVNKNLAIKEDIHQINQEYQTIIVKGPEQIFFVGKAICIADMPIDEAIKNNYTKYGEH